MKNAGGSGWTGSTWPESPGTADTTEWIYHEASGLLTAKKDAAGKQVNYTYSTGGKLASRTWARVNGTNSLVTTYSYGTAGDLTGIDYSDSTPDVTFTVDRLGRQLTAGSSISAHTFAYSGLLLDTETIVSYAGTNVIDRSYDSYGRSSGFTLGADYQVAYGYDSYGRFSSVTSTLASFACFAGYSYLPDSDLLSGYTLMDLAVDRTYEDHRNLLTQIKNEVDSTLISQYDYANDGGGRRTSVKYSGMAFETGNAFSLYDYNSRSEVIVGDKFWGANLNDTSDPVTGQGFAYAYDNIGNRTGASRDNEETTYTANNLNQYTQRTIPDGIDILGSAETNTTVTVNDLATTRHDKYWYRALTVTNSSTAAFQEVSVVGVYNPPGTNDPDIVTTETGHVFVAQTPEQFSYDDDGNLLSDGRFSYSWDAENRLISAETLTNLSASVPRKKVEFSYDYMSRRVSKTVYSWATNDWSLTTDHSFLYDSWNLVSEICNLPSVITTNHYVHGLDLSGSLQGAGGIGGLLASQLGTNNVVYSYDANGNVSELINSASGIDAHYEYSPFGETIVATGPLAKENKVRFSTKYWDDETGLGYWIFRYYSPSMGRWLGNDPLLDPGSVPAFMIKGPLIKLADSLIVAINRKVQEANLTPEQRQALRLWLNMAGWLRDGAINGDPKLFMLFTGNNFYRFCANNPINTVDGFGLTWSLFDRDTWSDLWDGVNNWQSWENWQKGLEIVAQALLLDKLFTSAGSLIGIGLELLKAGPQLYDNGKSIADHEKLENELINANKCDRIPSESDPK